MKQNKQRFIKIYQINPENSIFIPYHIKLLGDLIPVSISLNANFGLNVVYNFNDMEGININLNAQNYSINKNKQQFSNDTILNFQNIYHYFLKQNEINKKGINVLFVSDLNQYPIPYLNVLFIDLMNKLFSLTINRNEYLDIIKDTCKESYQIDLEDYLVILNSQSQSFHLFNQKEHELINHQKEYYQFIFLPMNDDLISLETQNIKLELQKKIEIQFPNQELSDLTFEDYIEFKANDEEKNMLLHMIYEFNRVYKAKTAIENNDDQKLGKLMNQSNDSIKNLLNLSNQLNDQLTIFSQASGALGSKKIKQGMIFLIKKSNQQSFIIKFNQLYENTYSKKPHLIDLEL